MAARGAESVPVLVDLSRATLAELSDLPDTLIQEYLTKLLSFDGNLADRRWDNNECPRVNHPAS